MTELQQTFIESFTTNTEGITHISTGSALRKCSECSDHNDYDESGAAYTEPYFSWSACDTCGSALGGNREDAHGTYDGELVHLAVCADCVVFINSGELPES